MAYKQLKLWFDKELAIKLANKIQPLMSDFNQDRFIQLIESKIEEQELKDRVMTFAKALYLNLGEDYESGIKLLLQILGRENEKETGMFKKYYWVMPIAKYVEDYGLSHFELSMQAIEEITKRNTGEYTIRPFLEQHTEETLKKMHVWSLDSNKHIRRLASEGGRPRLPWAKKLTIFINDPSPLLPILENLKDDRSKYVQKSVANCINDILKDNTTVAKKWIENWVKPTITKERKWIIKHALRNLRKSDDSWAKSILSKIA